MRIEDRISSIGTTTMKCAWCENPEASPHSIGTSSAILCDDCFEEYSTKIQIAPTITSLYLLAKKNRSDEALVALSQLVNNHPAIGKYPSILADVLTAKGDILRTQGLFIEALEVYEESLKYLDVVQGDFYVVSLKIVDLLNRSGNNLLAVCRLESLLDSMQGEMHSFMLDALILHSKLCEDADRPIPSRYVKLFHLVVSRHGFDPQEARWQNGSLNAMANLLKSEISEGNERFNALINRISCISGDRRTEEIRSVVQEYIDSEPVEFFRTLARTRIKKAKD